jgi:hypothetical protein
MNIRMTSLISLALAVALPAAASASCATYETVSYQCAPETRTWVSGHYEWVGCDYAYVPGHWVVLAASCEETRVVRPQPCEPTVVYTRPASTRTIVYERRSPTVVYTRPSCERNVVYTRPTHRRDNGPHLHVNLPLPPVAVLPVPIPVPFFGRHH